MLVNNNTENTYNRIAFYARVVNPEEKQKLIEELMQAYPEPDVNENTKDKLVGIYIDEGPAELSSLQRNEFNRMTNDCRIGKIDLIVTESVTQFSKDMCEAITLVSELHKLVHPVAVYFRREGFSTLSFIEAKH